MPHYKDGTVAKPGDVVRGKGYNIPHEVQGIVLKVVEAESCNITIATVKQGTTPYDPSHMGPNSSEPYFRANMLSNQDGYFLKQEDGKAYPVTLDLEYGACKDFEKIA